MLIPDRPMLAVSAFGPELPAARVVSALAKGIRAGDMPAADLCPIENGELPTDFDQRMRSARAVVVGAERLERETLKGSAVFEIATRARQAGVPAYAVTAANGLDAFDARMLDLQVVLDGANTIRALVTAGTKLAGLV